LASNHKTTGGEEREEGRKEGREKGGGRRKENHPTISPLEEKPQWGY